MHPEPVTPPEHTPVPDPTHDDIDARLRRAANRGRLPDPTADEVTAPATPRPLPGGGATPHYAPTVPSGEELVRGAIAAAKGQGVPHHLRPFIESNGTAATVTYERR